MLQRKDKITVNCAFRDETLLPKYKNLREMAVCIKIYIKFGIEGRVERIDVPLCFLSENMH